MNQDLGSSFQSSRVRRLDQTRWSPSIDLPDGNQNPVTKRRDLRIEIRHPSPSLSASGSAIGSRRSSSRRCIGRPSIRLGVLILLFSGLSLWLVLRFEQASYLRLSPSWTEAQHWLASRPKWFRLRDLDLDLGSAIHLEENRTADIVEIVELNNITQPPPKLNRLKQTPFLDNGLFEFNLSSSQDHPIFQLIKRAQAEWSSKISNQSTSLTEAVQTYRRKYRRNPPRGYDQWYAWARAHGVQLLDEYDQIMQDLRPLSALEGSDLRHRNEVMQTERDHSFVLAIDLVKKVVHAEGEWRSIRRATDMKNLLKKFVGLLPEGRLGWLNMSFIVDDQPGVLISNEHHERLVELSETGDSQLIISFLC